MLAACGAGSVEVAEPEPAATALATSAPEAVEATPAPEQPPTGSTPSPTSAATVAPVTVPTPEPTQVEPVPTATASPDSFSANNFEVAEPFGVFEDAPSDPVIPLDPGPEVPDWEPSLEQWETIVASIDAGVSDPDFDPKYDDPSDRLSRFPETYTGITVELPLDHSLGGYVSAGDKLTLISRVVTDGEPEIVMRELPLISTRFDEADGSVVRLVFAVDPIQHGFITEVKQSGDIVAALAGWPVEAEALVLLPATVAPGVAPVDGDIVSISVAGSDQPIPGRFATYVGRHPGSTDPFDFNARVTEEPLLLVGTPHGWLPTLASAILDDATIVVTVEQ